MASRTINSVKNSLISLLFYGVIIGLTFFSRRIFIDSLGIELLGLNTTIANLLSLLNLSEMGVATAISFTLYRPVAENDRNTIQEILSVQGWIYFIVALIVICGATVIAFFLPGIFGEATLPVSYVYATFFVFLFSSLLGYFFNYKQIMHSVSQQEYKNILIVKTLVVIKIIFQIIAIKFLLLGYQSWLTLECIFSLLTTAGLSLSIRKSYVWLHASKLRGRKLTRKYPIIFTKVKQLFFHKLAGVALSQISPLVIFAFTSLSLVAIYGNYMLILTGITTLISAAFGGITPIIGNMIVENNKEKERKVFGEYMVLKMLLGAAFAHCLLVGGKEFMILWMGEEFLLSDFSFLLLVAIGYINFTRPYDSFLIPYGRVEDTWAPLLEAGLNLGLSSLLGYYFSLSGILIGVLVSLIIIVLGWKAYFLATKGLEVSPFLLILRYFAYTLLFLGISYVLDLVASNLFRDWGTRTLYFWSIRMLFHFGSFFMSSFLVLSVFDVNMMNFSHRVIVRLKRNL